MTLSALRLILVGTALVLHSACTRVASDPVYKDFSERPVQVVATTTMIADLVRVVGGSQVEVEGLMGPGVDPHLFKATERDVAAMAEADLIVYNGLHLEGKMADVFGEMNARGLPTLAVAESIPESMRRESVLFQGNYDPHIWFDANLWKHAAGVVAEALSAMDPTGAEHYESNLEQYAAELDAAHAYAAKAVEQIPPSQRVLVTSHDAFGYYGDAYGFEVHGLQGISTVTEAGTADIQRAATLVADRKIPAMFIESSVSPRGIEAVREAVRARGFEVTIGGTLYGDALDAPGTPAGTYLGMLRHNTDTIVAALADGSSSRGT